jgi:hypothetical protein
MLRPSIPYFRVKFIDILRMCAYSCRDFSAHTLENEAGINFTGRSMDYATCHPSSQPRTLGGARVSAGNECRTKGVAQALHLIPECGDPRRPR